MKAYRAAVIGCNRMGGLMRGDVDPSVHPYQRPHSHGAGFHAHERTHLVACADLVAEVREAFGQRYGVPLERQYADYREMIDKEKPDIVSIATQPEPRGEIVVYAAEHGVRAIYAEKPMAASMRDADAMVEAVERNGVAFNLGARRRFYPGFIKMRQVIESGELGDLKALVMHHAGGLFNMGSHILDLTGFLNGDRPAVWVQGHLPNGDRALQGNTLVEDPAPYHGAIQFDNGVTGYAVATPLMGRYEAFCDEGIVLAFNDHRDFEIWRREGDGPQLVRAGFPDFEKVSPTTRIIEDLVHHLDTGEALHGGVRAARAGTELSFAFVESHRRGGARVELPLRDSKLILKRPRRVVRPASGS